jgi:hypothetical protein
MKVTRIGLDIAKQIFELHGVDEREGKRAIRMVSEFSSGEPGHEFAVPP